MCGLCPRPLSTYNPPTLACGLTARPTHRSTHGLWTARYTSTRTSSCHGCARGMTLYRHRRSGKHEMASFRCCDSDRCGSCPCPPSTSNPPTLTSCLSYASCITTTTWRTHRSADPPQYSWIVDSLLHKYPNVILSCVYERRNIILLPPKQKAQNNKI